MSTIQEALKPVLSTYVWKSEKKKVGNKYVQETEYMIDMTPEKLKKCYEHCNKMLYSDNIKHLGRYNVLKEIKEQEKKCKVELFLRYCENNYLKNERTAVSRNSFRISLREFMENTNKNLLEQGKPEIEDWYAYKITEAASQIPDDFQDLSIGEVFDGCIDFLG